MAQQQGQYPDPEISQIQDRAWFAHQDSLQDGPVEENIDEADFMSDVGGSG
jgi:hypothetical protein